MEKNYISHRMEINSDGKQRSFNDLVWKTDGVNDFANTTNSITDQMIAFNQPRTVSFWLDLSMTLDYVFAPLELGKYQRPLRTVSTGSPGDDNSVRFLINFYENGFGFGNIETRVGNFNFIINGKTATTASPSVSNFPSNRLIHYLITTNSNWANGSLYINGREIPTSIWGNSNINLSGIGSNYGNGIQTIYTGLRSVTQPYNPTNKFFDLLISSTVASPAEIRELYNKGTTFDYSKYPSNIMNNLILHLPLAGSNFEVIGSNLFANKTTNLLAPKAQIFGQGTTPTLVNPY